MTEEVEPVETLARRESIEPVDFQVQPVVLRWLVTGVDLQFLGHDGRGVRELRHQRRVGQVRGDPIPGRKIAAVIASPRRRHRFGEAIEPLTSPNTLD
ncbi:MAG: hypothetical protein L0I76_05855 [Pseudonocardia sp.]|nr:hypothetical protein [Pseudonocardia sp.]